MVIMWIKRRGDELVFVLGLAGCSLGGLPDKHIIVSRRDNRCVYGGVYHHGDRQISRRAKKIRAGE